MTDQELAEIEARQKAATPDGRIIFESNIIEKDVPKLIAALREAWASDAESLKLYRAARDRAETATKQIVALREALSSLVHEVEDTWHHHGRCFIGTDEQKPETECECGPDLEEHLAILARINVSAEGRIIDTSPSQPKVDPEMVREALGAERMTPEEATEWKRKHGVGL